MEQYLSPSDSVILNLLLKSIVQMRIINLLVDIFSMTDIVADITLKFKLR